MKKSANKLYDLDAIQKSFAKAAAASVPVENVSYPKPKIGSRLVDLGEEMARANGGIFLSPEAEGMHFGSPFGTINDKNATVVLPTVRDCVDAYGSWLEGSDYVDVEPERRAWILDKIFSMELVGKPVIGYMREIPSPSGYGGEKYYSDACPGIADTLLYIINHPDELAENMNEFVSLQESFENGVKPQEKPVVDAWFQDLNIDEKKTVFSPMWISRLEKFISGNEDLSSDLQYALDDLTTNLTTGWEERIGDERRQDAFLNEIFTYLPDSFKSGLYTILTSKAYEQALDSNYDVYFVGVNGRNYDQVSACIPEEVSIAYEARNYPVHRTDDRLSKSNLESNLSIRGITQYVADKDVYKTLAAKDEFFLDEHMSKEEATLIINRIVASVRSEGRKVVILTGEHCPYKNLPAIELGSALEREGVRCAYNYINKETAHVTTRSHDRVVNLALGNNVIENGLSTQIHFHGDGTFTTDPGVVVREKVVDRADRRLRGNPNYGMTIDVKPTELSPMSVVREISKASNSDIVFIPMASSLTTLMGAAQDMAGRRAVPFQLTLDTQELVSEEYAKRMAARLYADIQGIVVSGQKKVVDFDPKKLTAAFVGFTEGQMMVKHIPRAATEQELQRLDNLDAVLEDAPVLAEDRVGGPEEDFSAYKTSGKVRAGMGSGVEDRDDSYTMTGVTEQHLQVFFRNFIAEVEKGMSMQKLREEQVITGYNGENPVTDEQVDRERRTLAGHMYRAMGLQHTMQEAKEAYSRCKDVEQQYRETRGFPGTFDEFKLRAQGVDEKSELPRYLDSYKLGESFSKFRMHYFGKDNEAREQFIEEYEHMHVPMAFEKAVSDCNTGVDRSALMAFGELGKVAEPWIPKNFEMTVFLSTTKEGRPVQWQIREGKREYKDNKNHTLVTSRGQVEALMLNPFYLGLGHQFTMEQAKENTEALLKQNSESQQISPEMVRMLSQKFNYSPASVRLMLAEMRSSGVTVNSAADLVEFLTNCETKLGVRRVGGEISETEVVEAMSSVLTDSARERKEGIGMLTSLSEGYPESLKGWMGFEREEVTVVRGEEAEYVYLSNDELDMATGEELSSDLSFKNTGAVHVEYDRQVQRLESGKTSDVVINSVHETPAQLLYFRGDPSIVSEPTVMLTGDGASARPLDAISGVIRRMAGELADNNIVVVSVLRPGTDIIALREAVSAGARVAAFLPEGFDRSSYNELIDEIVLGGGCVFSEVAPEAVRGLDYDPARTMERAEQMAANVGKHVIVIDAKKEHGVDGQKTVCQSICENAPNGVSVVSYPDGLDAEDYQVVAGNKDIFESINNANGIDSVSLEGLSIAIRLSTILSPSRIEENNQELEAIQNEKLGRAAIPEYIKTDRLDFQVMRCGDNQVFIVGKAYRDVRDTIRETYGDNVIFASSREEAARMLYGAPVLVNGQMVDTFKGWAGTQPLGDRPYEKPLVYYKDVIYTPTNAPEGVVNVSSDIRLRHVELHQSIINAAKDLISEMNQSLELGDYPAMRFAVGRYLVVNPAGVFLYEGMGEDVEQDRLLCSVTLDSNGLLAIQNRHYGIDYTDDVIQKPRTGIINYDEVVAKGVINDLHAAIFYQSRRDIEKTGSGILSREEHEEVRKNIESGYYSPGEAAIDATSVVPYIGRTLFEPRDAVEFNRVVAIEFINRQIAMLEGKLKDNDDKYEQLEGELATQSTTIDAAKDLGDQRFVEVREELAAKESDLLLLSSASEGLMSSIALLTLMKQQVAEAGFVRVVESGEQEDSIELTVDGRYLMLPCDVPTVRMALDASKEAQESVNKMFPSAAQELGRIRERQNVSAFAKFAVDSAVEGRSRNVSPKELSEIRSKRREAHLMDPVIREEEVVEKLKNGKVIITREDRFTLATKDLHFLSAKPTYYKSMTPMPGSQRILVQKEDGKFNVLNGSGFEIFQQDFDEILEGSEKMGMVRNGALWNYVNWSKGGALLTEEWYTRVRPFNEGVAAFAMQRDGETGLGWNFVDKEGCWLLLEEEKWFSTVSDMKEGAAVGLIDGKTFSLSGDGDLIEVAASKAKGKSSEVKKDNPKEKEQSPSEEMQEGESLDLS